MGNGWDRTESYGERGPWQAFGLFVLAIVVIGAVFGTIGYVGGWFKETAQVAQEQFGPRALLQKYEWFKDAAAQLEKKQADVAVYDGRVKAMQETYKGVERIRWPRDDREQINVWASEVSGVKASYNQLAAEYNAQMAKFNYAFANVGELPKGATMPLPREFKPYETR